LKKWTAKVCIILEIQWFSGRKSYDSPKNGTQKYTFSVNSKLIRKKKQEGAVLFAVSLQRVNIGLLFGGQRGDQFKKES